MARCSQGGKGARDRASGGSTRGNSHEMGIEMGICRWMMVMIMMVRMVKMKRMIEMEDEEEMKRGGGRERKKKDGEAVLASKTRQRKKRAAGSGPTADPDNYRLTGCGAVPYIYLCSLSLYYILCYILCYFLFCISLYTKRYISLLSLYTLDYCTGYRHRPFGQVLRPIGTRPPIAPRLASRSVPCFSTALIGPPPNCQVRAPHCQAFRADTQAPIDT